jgi:hypothetical protein
MEPSFRAIFCQSQSSSVHEKGRFKSPLAGNNKAKGKAGTPCSSRLLDAGLRGIVSQSVNRSQQRACDSQPWCHTHVALAVTADGRPHSGGETAPSENVDQKAWLERCVARANWRANCCCCCFWALKPHAATQVE